MYKGIPITVRICKIAYGVLYHINRVQHSGGKEELAVDTMTEVVSFHLKYIRPAHTFRGLFNHIKTQHTTLHNLLRRYLSSYLADAQAAYVGWMNHMKAVVDA